LRQDDDVLNILNRTGAVMCWNRERLRNVCVQRRQRGARRARQLQEFSTIHSHWRDPRFS
jgi:hypothetical protein